MTPAVESKARPRRPWLRRGLQALGALGVVLLLTMGVALVDGCTAFGRRATGPRRERMAHSAHFHDGKFVNPQPLWNDWRGMLRGMFRTSSHLRPEVPPPVVTGGDRAGPAPASGLRVTWLGHSSLLLEMDGQHLLIDPVWSERASPLGWVGPRRYYPPPIPFEALPPIDAVVVSHDHYDHLDQGTIRRFVDKLPAWPTRFIVPLGLGANLTAWGIPEARIVELDWWERTAVGGLNIVCTPARHASGRILVDNDAKLWAGFAFLGGGHRVYFSGDTGLFPAMKEIGERLGPFDLTMIEVGQYDAAWPDWHIGPEQAVRAHQLVRGRLMLPIHWGLFSLAYHGWTEPIERALAAARQARVAMVAPRPGQSFEPSAPPPVERWWPTLPWRTGAEAPVVSTMVEMR